MQVCWSSIKSSFLVQRTRRQPPIENIEELTSSDPIQPTLQNYISIIGISVSKNSNACIHVCMYSTSGKNIEKISYPNPANTQCLDCPKGGSIGLDMPGQCQSSITDHDLMVFRHDIPGDPSSSQAKLIATGRGFDVIEGLDLPSTRAKIVKHNRREHEKHLHVKVISRNDSSELVFQFIQETGLLVIRRHLILNVAYQRNPHFSRVVAAQDVANKASFHLHLHLSHCQQQTSQHIKSCHKAIPSLKHPSQHQPRCSNTTTPPVPSHHLATPRNPPVDSPQTQARSSFHPDSSLSLLALRS